MLQSLPCESPGVGTKSGGHIVDGQTKILFEVSKFVLELETGQMAKTHKSRLHIISTCRPTIRSQSTCGCNLTGAHSFITVLLYRRGSRYPTLKGTFVPKANLLVLNIGKRLYICDYYGITMAIYVIRIGIEEATLCTLHTNNNLQNVFTYDILSC